MIKTLEQVMTGALESLSHQITTYLPPTLAALAIFAAAFILANLTRWFLTKTFKGAGLDRFLRESGLSSILLRKRGLESARLVTNAVYWTILLAGVLTGLNAFDGKITSRMVESTVFVFPKLVAAGVILLAGIWLAQYLGRTLLVWAVNEEIPHPRRWAAAVRIAVNLTAVVVAADTLDFAREVFLAAFIILAAGVVLALSLAFGLGGRTAVEKFFSEREERHLNREEALWRHL